MSIPPARTGPRLLFGMSMRQSALWTVFLIACAVTSMLMSLWPILTIVASLEAAIIGRQTLAAYRGQQVRVQSSNAARQGALTAAIEPLAPAVGRLGDPAVAEAHRQVLEIATEQPAAKSQIKPVGSIGGDDPRRT